ncbi:transposase [Desulfobacterota bacterium M19]
MARALRIQYPGALYHLTNRGNERRSIFADDIDRKQFLLILSRSIEIYNVSLYSFVLMQNHWHMLVETNLGNLGEFMRHFNITYTSYYNRRHNRSGHLYQGRYKSFLIEKELYLSVVSRYIHLNPVKTVSLRKMDMGEKLKFLDKYKWSSLPGYFAPEKRYDFLQYDVVLAEYGSDNRNGRSNYQRQIADDLVTGLAIRDKIVGQSIFGSETFINWVKENFVGGKQQREIPGINKIRSYLNSDLLLPLLLEELQLESVLSATGTARQILMAMLYKYTGLNNREIGEMFTVDYSTVSQTRKRLRENVRKNEKTRARLLQIEQRLSSVLVAASSSRIKI